MLNYEEETGIVQFYKKMIILIMKYRSIIHSIKRDYVKIITLSWKKQSQVLLTLIRGENIKYYNSIILKTILTENAHFAIFNGMGLLFVLNVIGFSIKLF